MLGALLFIKSHKLLASFAFSFSLWFKPTHFLLALPQCVCVWPLIADVDQSVWFLQAGTEPVRDRLGEDELSSDLHRNLLVIAKIEVYSQCTDRQSVSRTDLAYGKLAWIVSTSVQSLKPDNW